MPTNSNQEERPECLSCGRSTTIKVIGQAICPRATYWQCECGAEWKTQGAEITMLKNGKTS